MASALFLTLSWPRPPSRRAPSTSCDAQAAGLLRAQMIVHVISFAFLMVMASTAILSPVLLYVFGLAELGWRWEHAAMFSAIIASTDAVAVSAVLKSGA